MTRTPGPTNTPYSTWTPRPTFTPTTQRSPTPTETPSFRGVVMALVMRGFYIAPPEPTPTATATPTVLVPTPTETPSVGPWQLPVNPGFESDGGWVVPQSV